MTRRSTSQDSPPSRRSQGRSGWPRSARWRAYFELLRLPNIFTALADVMMGFLFTHAAIGPRQRWVLGFLLAASGLLYAAGVVLNDLWDREVDARERPGRPIPSGRVSVGAAKRLGWGLLAGGVASAWAAGAASGSVRPGGVGLLLAGSIVLYDSLLKRTPLGPPAMAACRMLNVLLGMSVHPGSWAQEHWLAAGAIGLYIAGVTWLARSETQEGRRGQRALASLVILGGIGLLAPLAQLVEQPNATLQAEPFRWYVLVGVLGALAAFRLFQAVADPTPEQVQVTVKLCLLSLVILDAAICYVVRDIGGAVMVLVLLLPAMMLGRWIAST